MHLQKPKRLIILNEGSTFLKFTPFINDDMLTLVCEMLYLNKCGGERMKFWSWLNVSSVQCRGPILRSHMSVETGDDS